MAVQDCAAGQSPFFYNALMHVTRSTLAVAAGATVLAVSLAVATAQQPPPQGRPDQPATPPTQGTQSGAPPAAGQPPAPPARAIIPASASTLGNKPDAYYGQLVSVYATVEQSLSPTAFSMDQDKTKSLPNEVLVLAPRLHEPVVPNSYVTVIGEVVRPDPGEIAKKMKTGAGGLTPEILAQHPGRPVILATAVINTALTDLAKFIPPPMTPEEAALDKTMKGVGAANGALRKGIDASNVELVKTNTAILTKSFADVEAFWKARGKADAIKFAQTARTAAQMVEAAAVAGNWNDAKTQNSTLGQQCQACHGIYRERGEDGSFFIKPGSNQ